MSGLGLFSVVAARIGFRLGWRGLCRLDTRRRIVAQIQRPLLPAPDEQRDRHAEKKETHKILMLALMNETEFEALAGATPSTVEQARAARRVAADSEPEAGRGLEEQLADGSNMVSARQWRAAALRLPR